MCLGADPGRLTPEYPWLPLTGVPEAVFLVELTTESLWLTLVCPDEPYFLTAKPLWYCEY